MSNFINLSHTKSKNNIILYLVYNPNSSAIINKTENNNNKLRIFGKKFVNKNKNKYKYNIIYKNKEFQLKEYFEEIDKDYNKKDLIKLKLRIINSIVDFSYMFDGCDKLISLSDNIKNNNHNVVLHLNDKIKLNKNNSLFSKLPLKSIDLLNGIILFKKFILLFSLSKFQNLEIISNYIDYLIQKGISISIKPFSNKFITNSSHMFNGCISLISVDLPKWNFDKTSNIHLILNGCNSLKSLPDIFNMNNSKTISIYQFL